MQCREFEERLQRSVDSRRDPSRDAELDGHAALCADCSAKREWFSALARMTSAFGSSSSFADASRYDRGRLIRETCALTREPGEPVVLAKQAESTVPVEPVRRRSRWLLAGSGLAVAAGVALFVTLAFLPWSPPAEGTDVARNDARPVIAEEAHSTAANTGHAVVTPSPDVAMTTPGDNVDDQGSQQALSLERLRASLTSLPSDPSMTGSLRPIASSFGVAWEAVRSALPTGRTAAEHGLDQADARGLRTIVTA